MRTQREVIISDRSLSSARRPRRGREEKMDALDHRVDAQREDVLVVVRLDARADEDAERRLLVLGGRVRVENARELDVAAERAVLLELEGELRREGGGGGCQRGSRGPCGGRR